MFVDMIRDLLRLSLKQWRRVRNFFYLCWAPFGVRPSSFRSEAGRRSPYKDLGWSVPLTPGLIYGFATEPMMRPMVEQLKSGPEGNVAADLMSGLADWLPHGTSVILLFCIIYGCAFCSWVFHGAMCWAFQRVGQTARNALFEIYLVRWAGIWTLFALTMAAMFIPAFAKYDEGWRRDVAIWIVGYPMLMAGLFFGSAILWFVANWDGFAMSEVYSSIRQQKFVRWVKWGISGLVVVLGYAWIFLQLRTMAGAHQG